ncbi:MAG: holo-ACP synthase [Candidatus Omnitrophica bacterium]|nr:holo-ACP synthase [Candidatus Omnitrophota bacterium]MBU4472572.1 holo-ACP synthase [Candidatus Omnitrophota bacterium]MCG2705960.1 holo-ACP synthase [Candidatus Omnitrophota bacterium]
MDKSIIGTGVDITEVRRLRQAVEKWGNVFLNRIFTAQELENAKTRGSLYQYLAGRFAAKEAVFKAMGDSELSWKEVEILNDKDGRPYCAILNGRAKKIDVHVSISHVKSYAVANAVITQKA